MGRTDAPTLPGPGVSGNGVVTADLPIPRVEIKAQQGLIWFFPLRAHGERLAVTQAFRNCVEGWRRGGGRSLVGLSVVLYQLLNPHWREGR